MTFVIRDTLNSYLYLTGVERRMLGHVISMAASHLLEWRGALSISEQPKRLLSKNDCENKRDRYLAAD